MFRYSFDKTEISKAKKFLKKETDKKPSFLNKFQGSIKKGNLYLENKLVIPKEDAEKFLRKKVLGGTVPLSRDGLYYFLSKNFVGISRKMIDKFLKAQNFIRETDTAQPTSKKASRRVKKKGQLSFDLIEINWDDLKFKPPEMVDYDEANDETNDSAYIFSCVDALTGVMYCEFSPKKTQKEITPIAKRCFKYFARVLQVPLNRLVGLSDKGSEFNFKLYEKWGLRLKQLPRASLIENKNAQFQAALYRIAKLNLTKNIDELVEKALKIVNRTKSRLTKVAPFEALQKTNVELEKKYNRKRGPQSGLKVKVRPLKIGDMVRLNLIGPKKTSFFKAYKADQWSKRRYPILAKRRNKYKIDGPKGKVFYHRDDLKLTSKSDKKTAMELYKRRTKLK